MRRRDVITLLGLAAIGRPLAARAQHRATPARIGIIDNAPIWDHFRQALRDLGYIEGDNIAYVYRLADGNPDRLAQAAADLARLPVHVIVTFGTPSTLAAKRATATIPIVMVSVGDPVGAELVASLARPGGNITGNTILGPEMASKRVQLLKELIPNLSRLAFLRNPHNASNLRIFEELEVVARAASLTLIPVEVRSPKEFAGAFANMLRERPDAVMLTNDPLQQLHMGEIIAFLAQNKLPGMFQARDNVVAGGLISYGASLPDLFRHAAGYVHKILQGNKPADLPVEQPTKFELVINLKTAKALGLAIPQSILLQVDEVIE
jgi:putative tryptophan/tyrosine transport system substrate-binding protein